jgi:hypothetical protein
LPLLVKVHLRDEVKTSPQTEALDPKPPEKVLDVLDITSQKVECTWVVVLYRLRDIDDIKMPFVKENIVFGKIGMDKFASVIHLADIQDEFFVQC